VRTPLTIDRTRPVPPARCSIDNEYYEAIDELWWDPAGPAAILHAINRPRVDFYLRQLGDLHGRLVLDAGCGGGLVARELAAAGATVVGLDRSLGSLGVARRAVGRRGPGNPEGRGGPGDPEGVPRGDGPRPIGAAFHPAQGRLERLPFAGGAFDAVVAADVLEHVPDLPAAVAELARVLAPGGRFAFDTINRTPWSWFTAVFGLERVLRTVPRDTHDWRLFIRPGELDRLLRAGGLEPVALEGLAPRIGPGDVARGLLTRRLAVPEFATGSDRRASYLGLYRKGGPGAPEGSGEPQRGAPVDRGAEGDSPRIGKGRA
jgi:2-polyprenyl-6-hydroxyphenyl methylase/3-demethylubiquinone-9 3-methyltransferase